MKTSKNTSFGPQFGNRLILADDEPLLLRAFSAYLTKAGYLIAGQFGDGDEVVEFFDQNGRAADILVLDYRMPRMDGLQTAKLLKQKIPDLKIVLCSAYSLAKDSQMDLFDAIIQKPCSGKELLDSIAGLLPSNEGVSSDKKAGAF